MILYDAHNHLQDGLLEPDQPEIFQRLANIGLRTCVVNGTTEQDWERVAGLAAKHPWILPSYGLHPWYLEHRSSDWERHLLARLNTGGFVGEIGLDRWKQPSHFSDQKEVFLRQLAIAAERNLPTTIHCLKAWGTLAQLLRENTLPSQGFLLHSYGGAADQIEEFAGRGAYFSFSGYFLSEHKAERLEVFAKIPLDRLLIETDAPSMPLPPEKVRFTLPESEAGQPVNHPANLSVIYEALAAYRGVDLEDLCRAIEKNFHRLFGPVCSPQI